MALALVFVAVALIVAALRGTQTCLFVLMKADASGQFLFWLAAIILVGSIGYVDELAPISSALLVLIIVVLFLKNRGVFSQLVSALQTTSVAPVASTVATPIFSFTNTPGVTGQSTGIENETPGVVSFGNPVLLTPGT